MEANGECWSECFDGVARVLLCIGEDADLPENVMEGCVTEVAGLAGWHIFFAETGLFVSCSSEVECFRFGGFPVSLGSVTVGMGIGKTLRKKNAVIS